MGIQDYSTNPDNNGVVGGVPYFPPSMLANAVDNAARQVMADIAAWLLSPLLKKLQNASTILDGATTPVERLIGYRGIPLRQVTAAATVAATDVGAGIASTTGGLTVPANATVAITPGDGVVLFFNRSNSNQTITPASGVTLRLAGSSATGARTVTGYGIASLIKVDTDEWWVSGAGAY